MGLDPVTAAVDRIIGADALSAVGPGWRGCGGQGQGSHTKKRRPRGSTSCAQLREHATNTLFSGHKDIRSFREPNSSHRPTVSVSRWRYAQSCLNRRTWLKADERGLDHNAIVSPHPPYTFATHLGGYMSSDTTPARRSRRHLILTGVLIAVLAAQSTALIVQQTLELPRDLGHSSVMPRGCVGAAAWSRLV